MFVQVKTVYISIPEKPILYYFIGQLVNKSNVPYAVQIGNVKIHYIFDEPILIKK